jgi:NitT/TauT family transport system ATP-binding protein
LNNKELINVNVSMAYGDITVLDDIKFKIYENEILVITGPSGCGKTTLVNLLAGIIKPTSGQITLRGSRVDPGIHNISFVFQEPSCIPWRTVANDISIGLEIKGADKETIRKRREGVIELVRLNGFEDYYPWQISGGMKQRVAIARAYATKPDLLIMDEPFGQLDAQTRCQMQVETERIWEHEKKTIVFITHNIEEAVYLATRVILLSRQPTRIRQEYRIDLPRPRDVTSREFLRLRADIIERYEEFEEFE